MRKGHFVTKSKVRVSNRANIAAKTAGQNALGLSATVTGQEQDGPPISLPTLALFAGHI